jgi:DNA-binding NarL/FixJ family response regulator
MRALLLERNDDFAALLPHIFEHAGIRLIGVRTEEAFWAEEALLRHNDLLVIDCSLGEQVDFERCTRIVRSTPRQTIIIHPLHYRISSLETIAKASITPLESSFSVIILVELLRTFLQPSRNMGSAALPRLSDQQIQVLQLMDQGLSDLQIASRLRIHVGTVKTHLSRIRTKWGIAARESILETFHQYCKECSGHIPDDNGVNEDDDTLSAFAKKMTTKRTDTN